MEDTVEQQNTPHKRFMDPRSLNMEAYKGMGFDENNYSPIPTVSGESSKRITLWPTSTPKPEDELILNRSDPTDNRGKVNRVNSFEVTHDRAATLLKISKGGPIKNLGAKIQSKQSTSNKTESCRQQLVCTACGGHDHLRKDCREDVFCDNCRTRSHTTEMCRATSYQTNGNSYAFTVVVLTTVQVSVVANLMTTERNQGPHPGTLGNKDPEWTTIEWVISHRWVTIRPGSMKVWIDNIHKII